MRNMCSFHSLAAIVAAVLLAAGTAAQEPKAAGEAKRIADATVVLTEIMDAADSAIPGSILGKAEGLAVFPGTIRGGFIVGGMRGRGVLSVRSEAGTWSAPAFLTMTGGSIGLQIGGQATDVVLVIMQRRGLENLLHNQFKIGADAGVAAGPVGRDAQASTDIQLRAQILSYSRARGLFAGVTINGSTIRQDRDANERFYGRPFETKQIVLERLGGAPEPVAAWRQALAKYAE
jgi:lipid-binding SYLF domain-containing protein